MPEAEQTLTFPLKVTKEMQLHEDEVPGRLVNQEMQL